MADAAADQSFLPSSAPGLAGIRARAAGCAKTSSAQHARAPTPAFSFSRPAQQRRLSTPRRHNASRARSLRFCRPSTLDPCAPPEPPSRRRRLVPKRGQPWLASRPSSRFLSYALRPQTCMRHRFRPTADPTLPSYRSWPSAFSSLSSRARYGTTTSRCLSSRHTL